jgi:hypothetical protein
VEAVREEGEGLWPRKTVASPVFALARFICDDPDNDLEAGREFKSGAIELSFMSGWDRLAGAGRYRDEVIRHARGRIGMGEGGRDARLKPGIGRKEWRNRGMPR